MSLYENMNRRKKAGTSRSKSKSTISDKAYANMKAGFPKKKKKSLLKRTTQMAALTVSQVAALKKHKVHHSAKHMKDMTTAMKAGKTFSQAHTIAKKNEKAKK